MAGDNIFNHSNIFFTMDGTVIGVAQTLIEGLSLLFGSYFVFNIVYEAEAQVTLEFFQRQVNNITWYFQLFKIISMSYRY